MPIFNLASPAGAFFIYPPRHSRRRGVKRNFMKNMDNQELSLIKIVPEDRAPDGNLLPEARKKILAVIKRHIRKSGYIDKSEIAKATGISRPTAQKLVDEIIKEWGAENEDDIIAQEQRYASILEDIRDNPETFDQDKVRRIQLQSSIFGKLNALRKIRRGDKNDKTA